MNRWNTLALPLGGLWLLAILVAFLLFEWGLYLGHQRALKTAYDTRKVSEELENACLSLWVGQQNQNTGRRRKINEGQSLFSLHRARNVCAFCISSNHSRNFVRDRRG